jgi:hypothetical protein
MVASGNLAARDRAAPRSGPRRRSGGGAIAFLATAAMAQVLPAGAQERPSVEELLQRLEQRDAAIARLEARVRALEQRVGTAARPASPPPPEPPAPERQATAAAPEPSTPPEARGAAPGEVVVDPDAAERALERTLVLTGDLLLPAGRVDFEPSISYSFDNNGTGRRLVTFDSDGDGVGDDFLLDTVRVERSKLGAAAGLRVGLPYDAQAELSVPFTLTRQETSRTLLAEPQDRTVASIGDVRVGLAKTLLREDGYVPDLIGRLTWDTNTGRDEIDGVSLDSGFNEIGVSFSALKRQDPLAFVGRVSYERSLENDGVQPGDLFGLGLSASLAASPETSLRLGADVFYRTEAEVNGRGVDGSNQTEGVLSVGVSSVLGPNTLLNVNLGVGLTEDSTDFLLTASVPLRFEAF